jgi:hypothetical protein
MATYKVTKVSQQEPRVWDNPKGGKIFYIKCMLEGHDRPVSIGKKSPDAIKVGDTVSGTITSDPSHEEDKFKADPPAFTPGGGGGKSNYTPPNEHAIAKSVALKAAVEVAAAIQQAETAITIDEAGIIKTADKFLAWLEADDKETKSEEPHYEDGGF